MPKSIVCRGVGALVGAILLPTCVAEQDRASLKHVRRWHRSFLLCLTIATGCTAGGAVEESVGEALGEGTGCVLEDSVLLASDGSSGDEFGYSLNVDGNVAIIGSHLSDEAGADSGSAYLFRNNGTSWVFEQKLVPPDGAANDLFGQAVAISGNVALVGAPGDDPGGTDSGSAYVYRYQNCDADSASEWCFEQKLLALDPAANDFLGYAVAISGTTAVVGAYGDDDGGSNSGAAYVFKYNGSTWVQQTPKLKAPSGDAAAGDFFGADVAVSGPVVLVGASADDNSHGLNAGAAYVFRSSGSTWTQEAKLMASDGAAEDRLGAAAGVSGDVVVLGAPSDDDNAAGSGSAYVFRYRPDTGQWTEEQNLLASDGGYDDQFGIAAAVSGDMILVGASRDSVGMFDKAGSAYVFGFDGSAWIEQSKLMAPDGASFLTYFGNAVSVSGDVFLIGHYQDNGPDAGSAAVFMGPCGLGECISHSDCDDSNPCMEDLCINGACINMALEYGTFCPADSNPCTSDICSGGVCSHPNSANGVWCNDNLYCNGTDTCSSGVCIHTGSPCAANQSCNESTNQCVAGGPVCGDGACDASGESCASCAADCRPDADLNLDCCVNSEDLGLLLGAWGPNSGNADLDGNGIVNASDLALLLAAWGCSVMGFL